MKLLKDQEKLFTYIDSDLKNWNVDEGVQVSGVKLKEKVMDKDFTFKDVFNPYTDYVSQEDVISWVEENKYAIKKTYVYYFFLLKNSKNEFFVAGVYFNDDGRLKLHVHEFSGDLVWRAGYRHRIVVPATSPMFLNTPQTLNPSGSLTLQPTDEDKIELQRAIGICVMNGYKVSKE